MSKAATQTKGEQAAVSIETGGDVFKSVTRKRSGPGLVDALVDECKVRFSPSGEDSPVMSITAVDAANVGMVKVRVPEAAFDRYEVPEAAVLGLELDELTAVTDYARKGGNSRDNPGDPVVLEKVQNRIYARVLPEDRWNRTGSWVALDPDSIRKEPDIPNLNLPWRGKADASNFRDAIHGVESRFDHVGIAARPADYGNTSLGDEEAAFLSIYGTEAGTEEDDVEVIREDEFRSDEKILHHEGDGGAGGVVSLFSIDYLKDMSAAIVKAGFDKVGLDLGDEFPLRLRFGGGHYGIHGEYMLAPRIQSSDFEGWEATWGDRYATVEEDGE